jgi:hypothetical protein
MLHRRESEQPSPGRVLQAPLSGTGDSLPTRGDGAQNAANVLAQLAAMVNKSQQAIGDVLLLSSMMAVFHHNS